MQKGSVFCQKFDQRSLNDDKFCFLLLFYGNFEAPILKNQRFIIKRWCIYLVFYQFVTLWFFRTQKVQIINALSE
jgi:hypothetical protein